MNKKLRKFLRDPKLFFKDMYLKRSRKIAKLTPKKQKGHFQYTVVSAVYNVEKYLDAYFDALAEQRLDFENNIQLIMVDDGSTDNSAKIIKRWQQKFPNNIIYLYKENGGQASARNLGIEQVKTEWVTFIDPDDFVDLNYFLEADNFLKKHQGSDIKLLSCNFIFYHEDKNQFSDTHPLKFRFAKGDCVLPSQDLGKHMQLSASSALFRSDIIIRAGLRFDHRIRPTFEDGHFVGAYLAELDGGSVGFAKNARYYYRKRSDGSSTLDTSWEKKERYFDVIKYGYLDLFNIYISRDGMVPRNIQRVVLYDLTWYVKKIVNKPEVVEFLDVEQRVEFLHFIKTLFTYIDTETIIEFELAGAWFFHKVGMLGAFKEQDSPFQIAYLEDYDPIKSQVLIRYFTREIGLEVFRLGDQDIVPAFAKTMRHDFLDLTFALERRIWVPLPVGKAKPLLTIQIGSHDARISLAGKQHREGVSPANVIEYFAHQRPKHRPSLRYDGSWLLMDRNTQADDNAEHLYRYICREYPDQRLFFVLSKDSHDWARLDREGFNLLAFGSPEHESALRACKKIISSHIDQYVVDYFNDGSLRDKQVVFLQHGVIHNDLSRWLNSKKRIDCFVTAADPEYASIAGDYNRYKYSRKEVVLTGLARHDALLQRQASIPSERMLLIMPTWRNSLVGKVISGNQRALNPGFMDTEYARAWNEFLHSSRLEKAAQTNGYRVVFFPHANIQPYLPQFKLPDWIEVLDHAELSIQELFARAALMITDFSSVAFDFVYLRKPVIYYQFDEQAFFSGSHIFQKGYFDYRRDGFGPVCVNEEELLESVEHHLTRNAEAERVYLDRMDAFYPASDGHNCQRIYEAIVALDQPMTDGYVDQEILVAYARAASSAGEWLLAESRWRAVLSLAEAHGLPALALEAQLRLISALRRTGRLIEARQFLDEIQSAQRHSSDVAVFLGLMYESACLSIEEHDWAKAIDRLKQLNLTDDVRLLLLKCHAHAGDFDAAARTVANLGGADAYPGTEVWLALAQGNWEQIVELLMASNESIGENREFCLLLAAAYRELGKLSLARSALVRYGNEFGKEFPWACELARLLIDEGREKDAITYFGKAYPEGVMAMPLSDGLKQIKARRILGDLITATSELQLLSAKYPDSSEIALEKAELAESSGHWAVAAELWRSLANAQPDLAYREAQALRNIGQTSKALFVLKQPSTPLPQTMPQFLLGAEIAHLEGDYNSAVNLWAELLRQYSDKAPLYAWERMGEARMILALKQNAQSAHHNEEIRNAAS